MFGLDRITTDPNIMGGQAGIRGLRISVSLIVNLVTNGLTVAQIIDEYPDLEPEDIWQAVQYASWAVDDEVLPPPGDIGHHCYPATGACGRSVRLRSLFADSSDPAIADR